MARDPLVRPAPAHLGRAAPETRMDASGQRVFDFITSNLHRPEFQREIRREYAEEKVRYLGGRKNPSKVLSPEASAAIHTQIIWLVGYALVESAAQKLKVKVDDRIYFALYKAVREIVRNVIDAGSLSTER